MKQLIVFILIITSFFSCDTTENSCGQAYIGGEIINPNNDFLVLYRDNEPIDSLYLDENNRFSYSIESLNPGLHTFVHGGEYQILIVEPNDSLMLRLNTIDFDESLVFTGRGSKKNNYLINLFLSLEKEERSIYKYSKLNPHLFQEKVDSIKEKHYKSLEKFTERYSPSSLFKKVSKIGIDYSYYTHKELYPYRHFGINQQINRDSLPTGYFDFRTNVNYEDEELKDFSAYYNFLFPHFNNLATEKYFEIVSKKDKNNNSIELNPLNSEITLNKYVNRYSLEFNKIKLELIDSIVHNNVIKNILLKYSTRNFLSHSKFPEDSEFLFNMYLSKNTNEVNAKYITSLYSTLTKLQAGNRLPEVELISPNNEVSTINTVSSRATVLYFWSHINKYHFKNSHNKVKQLKAAYPEIDFISININSNNSSVWRRLLKQNHIDFEHEYRFKNPQAAKKLLAIQYINKVIVIDNNKTIVSSNASLFTYDIKKILEQLQ